MFTIFDRDELPFLIILIFAHITIPHSLPLYQAIVTIFDDLDDFGLLI